MRRCVAQRTFFPKIVSSMAMTESNHATLLFFLPLLAPTASTGSIRDVNGIKKINCSFFLAPLQLGRSFSNRHGFSLHKPLHHFSSRREPNCMRGSGREKERPSSPATGHHIFSYLNLNTLFSAPHDLICHGAHSGYRRITPSCSRNHRLFTCRHPSPARTKIHEKEYCKKKIYLFLFSLGLSSHSH